MRVEPRDYPFGVPDRLELHPTYEWLREQSGRVVIVPLHRTLVVGDFRVLLK